MGEGVEMGVKSTPGRGIEGEGEGEGEGERVRTPSRGNRGRSPSSSGGHEVYVPGGWEGVCREERRGRLDNQAIDRESMHSSGAI